MEAVIGKVWDALKLTCEQIDGKFGVSFHEENYSKFAEFFEKYYNLLLDQFMTNHTTELDEHKQAAVIVISAIESNAIQQSTVEDNITLAPYAVALNVGLSFLLDRINEKIQKRLGMNEKKTINEFYLPYPLACDTPYFESLCRILYFENGGTEKEGIDYPMKFNIVEWADRFFLLEFILLQQNKINPWQLREEVSKG